MASFRRELLSALAVERAFEVVADLTGPGHWGRRCRTFALVEGDGGAGSRLVSTTWVFDEPVESAVLVVRREVGPQGGLVVITSTSPIGDASESLSVVPTGRGTLVEHASTVTSAVGDPMMQMWLNRFADECRDGLAAELVAPRAL